MENCYKTKYEAQRKAIKIRKEGMYFARVDRTGWELGTHQWAVYTRHKSSQGWSPYHGK